MTWLIAIGLTNAVLATLLASAAFSARWLRRPALAHLLWGLVLCKLLTPPLVKISLPSVGTAGGWLDPASWTDASSDSVPIMARPASRGTPPAIEAPSSVVAANRPARRAVADAAMPAAAPSARPPVLLSIARRSWNLAPSDLLRAAALVWIVGSLATLAVLARRAWRFRAFLRQAAHRDEGVRRRVAGLARSVGIAIPPDVLIIESVVSPMLWGVGRGARLLLPGPLVRRLDGAACDALVLHELAHYARGDGWVRLLELIVQVLYWWHPLVGWARRAIETAEEECCDAWVLQHQSQPRRAYAEALLATIDFLCEPAPPGSAWSLPPAASGLGELPLLRCRLTQIMRGEVAARPSRSARLLVLAAAVVVLPLGPTFLGVTPQVASARSTALPARSVVGQVRPMAQPPSIEPATAALKADAQAQPGADVPPPTARPSPAMPRLPAVLWATATSPNGKYRIEARAGRRTTLVHVESGWRLDLSAYKIACVSFSPDSRTLATGHDDSIVRVWDCETGGVLYSLKGSEAAIASLAIDSTGQRLAAGAADGSVLVWDLVGGEQIARLARQDVPVSCVRWSHTGDRLAVALGRWSEHEQASLWIWSPEAGDVLAQHALSEPAGALDWLADDESLVLAGWDGRGRLWRLDGGGPSGWVALSKDAVSAAGWSPDCPLISAWQNEQLARGAESEL